jgi:hypothetical protein
MAVSLLELGLIPDFGNQPKRQKGDRLLIQPLPAWLQNWRHQKHSAPIVKQSSQADPKNEAYILSTVGGAKFSHSRQRRSARRGKASGLNFTMSEVGLQLREVEPTDVSEFRLLQQA